MFEEKNFDGVFTRKVIVGISSFLYESLKIREIKNEKTNIKSVRFFYSMTGEEQFLQDYFLNTDKYCNVLSPKIEGNVNTIPSGVFTLSNAGINESDLASGYTRIDYQKKFNTEFSLEERDMSARADFIPMQYDFEAKVKCSSDLERMKVFEALIKKFYKARKFWIKFEGFQKLPVMMAFPDSYDMAKNFNFRYPDNEKRPEVVFRLQVVSYMPVIDEKTERFIEEKIETNSLDLEVQSPTEPEQEENINDQYRPENEQTES